MNEIIRLENVIKIAHHNRRAINGVSLGISKGERVQICGAPGSGKSTLMRLIAGMEPLSDGKLFVLDEAIHAMSPNTAACFRSKVFGISPCNPGFLSTLTVWENVSMPLAIRHIPVAQRRKSVMKQLNSLGLDYIANAYPTQLCAYESQIASLARASIAQPEILLLDEITSGLSEKEADKIMAVLNVLYDTDATVIIFTTAEIDPAFSNRRIVLDYGKIKEESR